jgi:hypothetical protein
MPTNLDGLIVVGFFTYDEDTAEYHREIDIEFNNGAVVGSDAPWQYVVQPYSFYGQRFRFSFPTNSWGSTHSFLWAPGVTHFDSFYAPPWRSSAIRATYTPQYLPILYNADWRLIPQMPPFGFVLPGTITKHMDFGLSYNPSYYIRALMSDISIDSQPQPFESWGTTYGIPDPGTGKVHINMWLFNGSQPADTNKVFEIVLSKFEFRAVDANALVPKLKITHYNPDPQNSQLDLQFTVPAR